MNRQRISITLAYALFAIALLYSSPAFAQYIGPQGVDTVVIKGVNTAGTVRVNNLGCLEALFNIVANGTEIVGIIWASVILVTASLCVKTNSRKAKVRLVIGIVMFAFALSAPSMVNWLVATARDVNLFS